MVGTMNILMGGCIMNDGNLEYIIGRMYYE